MSALDRLRKLDAEATKGPWHTNGWDNRECFADILAGSPSTAQEHIIAAALDAKYRQDTERCIRDAKAIVALRNALPALITLLEAADKCKLLMLRPAHIAGCGAYRNRYTGECTCGVDAAADAYDAAEAAFARALEGEK